MAVRSGGPLLTTYRFQIWKISGNKLRCLSLELRARDQYDLPDHLPSGLWNLLSTHKALEELSFHMHPYQAYWHSSQFESLFSLTFPHLRKFSIDAAIFTILDAHYPRFVAFFCAHPLLEEVHFPGDPIYWQAFPSKAFSNVSKIAVTGNLLANLPYKVLDQLRELELLTQLTVFGQLQAMGKALGMVKGVRKLKLNVQLTEQWLSGSLIQWILPALPVLEELEVFSPFQYYHAGVTPFSIVGIFPSLHLMTFPRMICRADSLVLTFIG
jgi:hypothetical protein